MDTRPDLRNEGELLSNLDHGTNILDIRRVPAPDFRPAYAGYTEGGTSRMADEPAPGDFFAKHRSGLGLLARLQLPAWLRPKLDPSDLVQQTLLEVHRERDRLAALPDSDCAAYLRRCLKHNLIDAVRKFRPSLREVDFEKSSARIESWLAADDTQPGERLAREERLKQLADALAALPESQRTAVECKYLQGLAVREIASRMGCSDSAVGGLLRRGVRELRRLLGTTPGATDDSTGS